MINKEHLFLIVSKEILAKDKKHIVFVTFSKATSAKKINKEFFS